MFSNFPRTLEILFLSLYFLLAIGCGKEAPETVELVIRGPRTVRQAIAAAEGFRAVVRCPGLPEIAVSEQRPQIELPPAARNCRARLLQLVTPNGAAEARPGSDFPSDEPGSSATFVTASGASYAVTIMSQLPQRQVAFFYTAISTFGETNAQRRVGVSFSAMGDNPPFLRPAWVSYGDADLDVLLECRARVSGDACQGDRMAEYRVTMANLPAEAITRELLTRLAASERPLSGLRHSLVAPGSQIDNGGIYFSLDFDGRTPRDQILILRNPNSNSFLYGIIRFSVPARETQLQVISVYEASGPLAPRDIAQVTIDNSGKNTVIAMTAYRPTRWNLDIRTGSAVTKIFVGGYGAQTVVGAPPGVEIVQLGSIYAYEMSRMGEHVARIEAAAGLRAVAVHAAYQANEFYLGAHSGAPIPPNVEYHFVGIYEASQDHTVVGNAEILVDRPGRDVVLILSTYEPVRWNIRAVNGTRISRVIYNGYNGSVVRGSSIDGIFGADAGFTAYRVPSFEVDRLIAQVETLLGTRISLTSAQGAYFGTRFEVR